MVRYWIYSFLALCMVLLATSAAWAKPKSVLMLHSYHHELSWNKSIQEGVESVFAAAPVEVVLQTEFMDTKRKSDEAHYANLLNTYRHKFAGRSFDVVMCSDNNALNFLLLYSDELFPDTPVVFCGVNNYTPELVGDSTRFTGAAEAVAFGGTIETVLFVQPDVETIYVYGAATPTWEQNKKLLLREYAPYADKVRLELVEGLDVPKAVAHMQTIGPRSAVLLTSAYRDGQGELLGFEQSTSAITKAAPVPVYGLWDFQLGSGIVGGKLISGVAQGETAAELALRLLQGESVVDVPVITDSPNRHLFDYEALARTGLWGRPLPIYSEIINEPSSFYLENKEMVWAIAGVITLLSSIIAILVVNIFQRKKAQADLAASEESYRSIFNSANDPIFVHHAETGEILDVNDAVLREFRVTYDEALSLSVEEMSDFESGYTDERAIEMIGNALEQGAHVFEWRCRRKDGSVFWCEVSLRYTTIMGEPRVLALARNISERKEADTLFRETLEHLPVAVAVNTGDVVDYVNRKFEELLGYSHKDIPHLDAWWPLAYPDEETRKKAKALWENAVTRAVQDGVESEVIEYPVLCADGSEKDIEFVFLPLGNGGITTFVDVTERNRSTAEISRQRTILSTLINSVPDQIFYKNLEGQYMGCNQALADVVGMKPSEMVGMRSEDLFSAELAKSINERDKAVIESRTTQVQAEVLSYPDGETIELEIKVTPMVDEDGELIGLAGIGRDVSEREAAKLELERLVAELEDKNAELERFTYTVSHDLKSPIITITGFVGMLKHDLGNSRVEDAQLGLDRIEQAAQRMAQLLDELLELSRIGRMDNPMEKVSMAELAKEAADMAAGRITACDGQIAIADNLPVEMVDRIRMREVFMNLIDNAAKFMPEGVCPEIEIGVREESGRATYYVADNGIGIAPEYLDRVFNLFEQLDPRLEGTGIGLALVKRIIEQHGGSIWVESAGQDKGACFCFTLGDQG